MTDRTGSCSDNSAFLYVIWDEQYLGQESEECIDFDSSVVVSRSRICPQRRLRSDIYRIVYLKALQPECMKIAGQAMQRAQNLHRRTALSH